MLYSKSDVATCRFFIDQIEDNPDLPPGQNEAFKKKEEERLKYMTFYSTTSDCLRKFMLRYFGDRYKSSCGKCSNCLTKKRPYLTKRQLSSAQAGYIGRNDHYTGYDLKRNEYDEELLKALEVVRLTFAKRRGVPAFVIFTEADLLDMCRKLPVNEAQFLSVSGVSRKKFELFGEAFLRVIRKYVNERNGVAEVEKKPAQKPRYISYMEKAKANYSGAYAPWTEEEINRLKEEYASGMTVKQMSDIHGRTQGAIQSRLKKEGLVK